MALLHFWGEDQGLLHGSSKDRLRQDRCQSGFSTASSSDKRSSWFLDLLSETSRISRGNSKVSQDRSHLYQLRVESLNKAVLFSLQRELGGEGEFKGQQSEIHPRRLKGRVLCESGIMFTRLYRKPLIRRPLPGLTLKVSGCTTDPCLARNL